MLSDCDCFGDQVDDIVATVGDAEHVVDVLLRIGHWEPP
jgi:hypothetical protein